MQTQQFSDSVSKYSDNELILMIHILQRVGIANGGKLSHEAASLLNCCTYEQRFREIEDAWSKEPLI